MLEYQLVQAPHEKAIIRACIRERRPYPKAIASAPVLFIGHELYYDAFEDLGSCRFFEGGFIPWLAILAYADEYAINGDLRDDFFAIIKEIDLWFVAWLRKQLKGNKPTKSGKGKRA